MNRRRSGLIMAEDDNDFMGSSFRNYDTTENRMDEINSGSGTGDNHGKMEFKVAGRSTPTGRMAAGTAVLILCEIIAVASKVDGEYGLASLASLLVACLRPL